MPSENNSLIAAFNLSEGPSVVIRFPIVVKSSSSSKITSSCYFIHSVVKGNAPRYLFKEWGIRGNHKQSQTVGTLCKALV